MSEIPAPNPSGEPQIRLTARLRQAWRERPARVAATGLLVVYALTVLGNAWLCDDAYITFRVVDNVINGLGPVWNVGERVQAYTNPLMMLLMSGLSFVTREVYFTGIALSVVASVAAVAILVLRVSRSDVLSIVALLPLTFSGFFVAYSTSGLENCLIFLLLALFFWVYSLSDCFSGRSLLLLTLLFSVSLVNRMDTAILLLPPLCWAYWRNDAVRPVQMIRSGLVGMLPFAAWEVFAVVYYGFPFPNTAYAKLYTGVPQGEYIIRGIWYYVMTFVQDPVVLLGTLFGCVAILLDRRLKTTVPLMGVALYLIYIVRIGGDFMRGRYFTAPLFMVMLVLVMVDVDRLKPRLAFKAVIAGALALLLFQNGVGMVYGSTSLNKIEPYWINDDKTTYFARTSLLLNLVENQRQKGTAGERELLEKGVSPVIYSFLGFAGYYGGPQVHIIDHVALSDALLARLPAMYDPDWKVGHHRRYIPDGYMQTVRTGRNAIEDPDLAAFYDQLRLVTSGEVWSRERWMAILALNTGKLDHLVDRQHYRFGVREQFDISQPQFDAPSDADADVVPVVDGLPKP